MPTFGYLPYQGWALLFIFLTLKHFPENACIFQKKNISLHKKRRIIKTRRLSMDLFDSKRQERLEAAKKGFCSQQRSGKKIPH